MPPKRAASGAITSKTAQKVPKIIQNQKPSQSIAVEDRDKSQIQKLANAPDGGRVLWKAVDAGNAALASKLIQAGADLTFQDPKDNCTVLHQVVRTRSIENNAKRELVRLLIEYGADINARDREGSSVLNDALVHSHCSSLLVEQLLKCGANLTFGGSCHLDDIKTAATFKPDVMIKLIKHQADEETRKNISIFALGELIMRKRNAAVLHSIKDILDLGVPVNTFYKSPTCLFRLRSSPLLSIALYCKEKDVIKLLLEYGADAHQKDNDGCTPLYQATAFKGYTHASRWLIEKGASLHARNDDGCYPIHGACLHDSLRNVHLFLNLGADLNVTDNEGCTPFSYTKDTFYFNEAHSLVIKHFCLIIARGGRISKDDMERANQYVWGAHHFRKCTKQLEQMKVEMVYDDVSYFSVLSENICKMIRLMKNPSFARNFKRNNKKLEMFPEYSYMLLHAFEIAEMRYNTLLEEKRFIEEGFGELMPDHIVEKIAYYLCFGKLKQCQHNFYMSLHESLKNNKASKEKIQ